MKKEEIPVLVGLVLVGFFMLFFLASSVGDLSLTGYVVVGVGLPCGGETNDTCTAGLFCNDDFVCEAICTENWACSDWTECINGTQTKSCTDTNNCGTEDDKPDETQTCVLETCTPNCTDKVCGDSDGCEGTCEDCEEGYSCESNSCELIVKTCTEEWNCGSWSDCSGSSQTRTCTDTNDCGTEENKPTETQTCEEDEETTETELVVEDTTPVVTGKTVEQIIAEMEAEQEVKTQEEVEDVETEEELEPLGEITGGIVGGEFNESECDGCVYDKKKCYDFNKRKNDSYCTEEGWIVQKEINATCVEDFECLSNSCVEEQCGDYNWIRKFFNWIRDLFIKEIKINENQTIVNESEIIELG